MAEIGIIGVDTSAATDANRPKSMWTGSANRDDLAKLVAKGIHLIDVWKYPLDSILSKFKSKTRTEEGFEFSYFEDKSLPHTMCVKNASGYSSSATSVIVDSAASARVYDLALIHGAAASELALITAINGSTNTLTLSRGFGGTAQALANNQVILNLQNIAADMSVAPYSRVTVPTEITQYMRGQRTSWSLSAFYDAWKKYHGENIWNYQHDKGIFEHRKGMELNLFFSHLKKDTSIIGTAASLTNAVAYTFRGIQEWISTYAEAGHTYDCGGTINEDNFYQYFLEPWQAHNPEMPMVFCCWALINGIQKWHRGLVRITPSTKLVGLKVYQVQYPGLDTVTFVHHPLLEPQSEPTSGLTEGVKKGWAFGLDLANIEYIKGSIEFTHGSGFKGFTDTWVGVVPQSGNPWYKQEEIASLYSIEMKGADNHIVMNNIGGYN